MAELILTEAEKEADTYLDWDDESIGKLCRNLALKLDDEYGDKASYATTVAHILIGFGVRVNSTKTEIEMLGLTNDGEPIGDWRVTVEQIKEP